MKLELRKSWLKEIISRYYYTKKVEGVFHFDERCSAMVGTGLYELVLGHITLDHNKKIHVWGPSDLRDYDGASVFATIDGRYITNNLYVDTKKVKRYAVFAPLKKNDGSGVVDYFDSKEGLEKKIYMTNLS